MPASKISTVKAKQDKLFYFVANVVVYRESDKRCLILKRDPREKVHPGKWAAIGGKLEWGDFDLSKPTRMNGDVLDFEDAVETLLAREVAEESGVRIERDLKYINSIFYVSADGVPVVLVKFAARYAGGDVQIEKDSFTDFTWATADEARKLDCIKGIPEEIAKATELFCEIDPALAHGVG